MRLAACGQPSELETSVRALAGRSVRELIHRCEYTKLGELAHDHGVV